MKDYNKVAIVTKIFKQGMKVTVSVKDLFESGADLYGMYIETEENENGETDYWDLHNGNGYVVCMDGETCLIISEDEKWVTLRNDDGEVPMFFTLSLKAASVACTVCPT